MRAIAIVFGLGGLLGGVAAAEPRASVGLRTTWNPSLEPPAFLFTGGVWGLRIGDGTWLVLDADGMRAAIAEQHDALATASARTLMAIHLGPRVDVVRGRRATLVALGGAGVAIEWAQLRTLGEWTSGDVVARPTAFAGVALEHRVKHGAVGLQARAVRLFGGGATSMAPVLPLTSGEVSVELSGYY